MANTDFAYPCTRGNSKIGKIMSERMISTLVATLAPDRAIGLDKVGNYFKAILLDGYYFHLDTLQVPQQDQVLYFYTESSGDFPEMYVENGECLFTSAKTLTGYTEHSFNASDIKTLDEARSYSPYYIANASDDTKIGKIWINSTDDAMNPYVWDGSNWVPLGAVYKTT